MAATGCEKAIALTQLADTNGWDAELTYGPDHVDVVLASNWKHPDEGDGWEWGAVVRWYQTNPNAGLASSWRLGALDDSGKRVVGGVAKKLPDGPEFEYWLGSIKMLERFILDADDLVAWFEKVAPR